MRTLNRPRQVAFGVIAIASLAALAGCAPEPSPTPSRTPASPSAAPPTEAPDASCLVGDWRISQEQLQGFYDAVAANSDGLSFTIEGGSGLSFTETNYTYTPDYSLLIDVAGMPGEGDLSGSIEGEYTVDDGVITTVHDESDVEFIVTVNGTTSDGTELFGSLLSGAPINDAPFSCAAEGPVIEFSTGGETRVPVQLTAR